MSRSITKLQLCVEPDSEPISGSVAIGGGSAKRFSGWIELVAAIESARQEEREPSETLGWLPGAKPSGL